MEYIPAMISTELLRFGQRKKPCKLPRIGLICPLKLYIVGCDFVRSGSEGILMDKIDAKDPKEAKSQGYPSPSSFESCEEEV